MEWLSKFKNTKNYMWYALIAVGIVLMLISSGGRKNSGEKDTQVHISSDEYIDYIETRLKTAISDIEGVGDVSVTITLENSGEIVVASDVKETSYGKEKSLVVVNNQPLVLTEKQPSIKGIVITAEGAGNISTREKIISAAKTLTGAEAYKIAVFEKK